MQDRGNDERDTEKNCNKRKWLEANPAATKNTFCCVYPLDSWGDGWSISRVLTKENGLAGEKVRSLFQDRYKRIWFGSENRGVAYLTEEGKFKALSARDGLSANEVKVLLQDVDGSLWIGTNNGLTIVKASALKKLK